MPQPDPVYWPRFCEMIGRPEWKTDPRCVTLFDRRRHTEELTREIDALFGAADRETWAERLDQHGLIWGCDWGNPAIHHDFIDQPHVQRVALGRQAALFKNEWYPDDSYDPYKT